ncbi:MAG: dihydroorotase [Elusimicrobia bacterium]|nr:dihydroorotase [Elusimicrobiota bacterium]
MTKNGRKILIKGGRILDPSQNLDRALDLLIEGDRIQDLKPNIPAPVKTTELEVWEAKGLWVLPGLIDMHVHLREPGRETDETIASGTRAAASGGVTSVVSMPNTEPPIDSATLIRFVLEKAKKEAVVNVFPSGCVTKGQKGEELAEMGLMAEAGAIAFTDDGKPVMNAQVMRRALEYSKSLGFPVLDHCEDAHLSGQGVMNEGVVSSRMGVRGIPTESETLMALRDISLAELTGGRLHIAHVSCAGTVEAVRQAKRRGVRVTAETCPHYFALTEESLVSFNANFKMNPPLRRDSDVEAVREGLRDGTLDAIATDHAPHSPSRKEMGLEAAPFGVIGLETLLPLTLTTLVHSKVLTPLEMVRCVSTHPAKLLGLKMKGGLRVGMDADITLVDPNREKILTDRFESKSKNSPFVGWKLKGFPVGTIVGGKVVYKDGMLV